MKSNNECCIFTCQRSRVGKKVLCDIYPDSHTYRIFVLAQDQRFELAAFDGDDGNGYYGTGFWFTVKGINND